MSEAQGKGIVWVLPIILALGGGLRCDDPLPFSSQHGARRRALLLGLREGVPVDIYEDASLEMRAVGAVRILFRAVATGRPGPRVVHARSI